MNELKEKRGLLIRCSYTIALAVILISIGANAGPLTTPNTFAAGTPAVAAEVNANFSAVETEVNDNDARIAALAPQISSTDVFTFFLPDGTAAAGDIVGTAELQRAASGVAVRIDTTMLTPGNAYSVWWIIFNNPGACDPSGCSDADFGITAVEASVLNATGRVADANGNGDVSFNAFLPVGFIHTAPASGNLRQPFGPGLQNVQGAEIHLVIKSHGPATGNIEQISTLMADCVDPAVMPAGCYDPQAMMFPLP